VPPVVWSAASRCRRRVLRLRLRSPGRGPAGGLAPLRARRSRSRDQIMINGPATGLVTDWSIGEGVHHLPRPGRRPDEPAEVLPIDSGPDLDQQQRRRTTPARNERRRRHSTISDRSPKRRRVRSGARGWARDRPALNGSVRERSASAPPGRLPNVRHSSLCVGCTRGWALLLSALWAADEHT
jgi:hypothetical protein